MAGESPPVKTLLDLVIEREVEGMDVEECQQTLVQCMQWIGRIVPAFLFEHWPSIAKELTEEYKYTLTRGD